MRVSVVVSVVSGAEGRGDFRPFPTNQDELPDSEGFIANDLLMEYM